MHGSLNTSGSSQCPSVPSEETVRLLQPCHQCGFLKAVPCGVHFLDDSTGMEHDYSHLRGRSLVCIIAGKSLVAEKDCVIHMALYALARRLANSALFACILARTQRCFGHKKSGIWYRTSVHWSDGN